jgi:quinol monooxygenase YgiN
VYIARIIFDIKSGQSDDFKKKAQKVADLGRQQPGCLYYEIFAAQSKPNSYLLYEEWERKEDFDVFKMSAEFKYIGEQLTQSLDGAPTYTYYSADIT